MRHYLHLLSAFSILLGMAVGPARTEEVPTFEKDILPLFEASCVRCHGAREPKAGLDLRSRASLIKGGRSGPALRPGSLRESHLWVNIATDRMPASGEPLTDAQKDLLRKWILAGAPGAGVPPTVVARPGAASRTSVVRLGVAEVARRIDEAIDRKLAEAGLPASPAADDAEILRRAYLDITGRIPTLEQARTFLESKDEDKRARLIEQLLASAEYGQYQGSRWARLITAEEPSLRSALESWLARAFNEGQGWDVTVHTLLTATGKGAETAFVMSNVENRRPQPEKLAASTSRLFLGMQLDCAQCHNHPFTEWKQVDFWALAAFFSRTLVQAKGDPAGVAEVPPTASAKGPAGPVIVIPSTAGKGAGKTVRARLLGGEEPPLEEKGPYRPTLASWVTARDNPYFARATVNRLWSHFMGQGLVNPVDAMYEDNPASHPEVLQVLAEEFRASGYDLKHLVRCICSTRVYQRSSRVAPGNEEDYGLYSRMAIKVMPPEALYSSLLSAMEVKSLEVSAGPATSTGRGGARRQAGQGARDRFLRLFDTTSPDGTPMDYTHGIPQALSLMNDPVFNQTAPIISRLMKDSPGPAQVVEGLFLAVLSRYPTSEEARRMTDYVARQAEPARGYAGVLWVLINAPELVLIR